MYLTPKVIVLLVAILVAGILYLLPSPRKAVARRRAYEFNGFHDLTPLERNLLLHFFGLPLTELWLNTEIQQMIFNVCAHSDTRGFRKMLEQLKGEPQAEIIQAIGFDGLELIERWQPVPGKVRSIADPINNDSSVHSEWEPAHTALNN